MKQNKYILTLLMLFLGITTWAQTRMPYEYASVCSNQGVYYWRGIECDHSGTYHASDEFYIYTLVLTMEDYVHTIHSYQMPQGGVITVRYKNYYEAGTYYDTISGGESHCDTIDKIVIDYSPYYFFHDEVHSCGDTTFYWRGQRIYQQGEYERNYRTADGRHDSIYHLSVYFHQPVLRLEETRYGCRQKLPYRWNGLELYEEGDTTFAMKSRFGCDSIVTLHLFLRDQQPKTTVTTSFCKGNGIFTHGEQIHQETTYTSVFPSYCGCDSIIDSVFIPYPGSFFEEELGQHFRNQPYNWHGKTYTTDGIYQDTMPNKDAYGCDSIYQLRLVTKYDIYITKNLCHGDIAEYRSENEGTIYVTTESHFEQRYKTIYGGDSVVHFDFYFKPKTIVKSDEITICGNESYRWEYAPNKFRVIDGGGLTGRPKTTVVEQKLTSCEVAQLTVNIVPYYFRDSIVIMCNEDVAVQEFVWRDHYGNVYRFGEPNMDVRINDTINAPHHHEPTIPEVPGGCDSIVRFRFISTASCSKMDSFPLCNGDSLYIDRRWYKEPGTYFNVMHSLSHAERQLNDSTHNFTIYRAHTDTLFDTIFVCESNPVERYGISYNATYDDTIRISHVGQSCDSLVIFLHVESKPNRMAPTRYIDVCGIHDIYVPTRSGKILRTPGLHYDTVPYPYEYGCDSIFPYYIRTHEVTYKVDTAYMRPNEQYHWTYHGRDSILSAPGIYVDSTTTALGCDSVHTLVLNLNDPLFKYDSVQTCVSDLPYVWHGFNFYQSIDTTIVRYDIQRDSIFRLNLTVNDGVTSWRNIALLPNKTYNFHGHILRYSNVGQTFLYTTSSLVTGCDSIEKVTITPVQPVYRDTVLCPHQQVVINDSVITEQWSDTTCVEGSWSITVHVITRANNQVYDSYQEINEGETYTWQLCDGTTRILSVEGSYLDSCVSQYGCDSINRLRLVVRQDKLYSEQRSVCYRDLPYHWHDQWLENDGTYTARYTTVRGRDSIFTIDFRVIRPIHDTMIIDTCYRGYPISINNRWYRTNAAFVDTFVSVITHCDSIVHYILRLHYPTTSYEQRKLTEGSSITWQGMTITSGGVYTKTLTSQFGCDSTLNLIVTMCPQSIISQRYIYACEGDVIRINGDTITTSGTWPEYNKTANGCDSIVMVKVDFAYTDYRTTTQNFYRGDTVRWKNRVLTQSGIYYDTIRTYNNLCDSLIHCLILRYTPITERDTTVIICEVPYSHHGQGQYDHDTTFVDTLRNFIGKDSMYYTTYYRVSTHCSDYDIYYRCPGDTLHIEGLRIGRAGDYAVRKQTEQHQDSLYRFTVRDAITYEITTEKTGCDSIEHNGRIYRYPGNDRPFTINLRHESIYGCDSIEHLVLTIHSSKQRTEQVSIADFEVPYYFAGRPYYESGIYPVQFYTSPWGCDSIVYLNLRIRPTINDTTHVSYCKGDPAGIIIFGRRYYPTEGMVIDSLFREGENLIRRTVVVHVDQPFAIAAFNHHAEQIVCSSDPTYFEVSYEVVDQNSGALPTYYDVEFYGGELPASPRHATYPTNGQKDLQIPIYGQGTSVAPGYYNYRVKLRSEGCSVSDTAFTGTILVRYPSDIMEANWNNVVALVNENYNAGHWVLQPPYTWQVWDEGGEDKTALVAPTSNAQPYIASDRMRENDVVVATLYRDDYQRPIPTCPFTFHAVATNGRHPILVYPTATSGAAPVHVQSYARGAYEVFNQTGDKCRRGALAEGDNTVQLPSLPGCYLLQITLQDGVTSLQRLIVY